MEFLSSFLRRHDHLAARETSDRVARCQLFSQAREVAVECDRKIWLKIFWCKAFMKITLFPNGFRLNFSFFKKLLIECESAERRKHQYERLHFPSFSRSLYPRVL